MPRKRATIREVARATGLSQAAVSYALRGVQVAPETVERVRAAAAELGYEADPIARALASGRTGMIGVLCASLEDLWQQSLAVGISRGLRERDRYALILDAAGDPARERALAGQLRDQRVDGLIVQPLDPAAPFWPELCASLPVVAVGDSLRGTAAEVVFDNRRGVTLALEHLRALGHRRVGVLTPTRPSTPDRPADVHVLAEAERLGLDIEVASAAHGPIAATRAARDLLGGARPSAVFCFADSIAYGVYAAARELGLSIPGDVSVMGYDDHPMSGLLTPELSTVDWNIDGIVGAAVRLMTDAADGQGERRRVVQLPTLRERESVADLSRRG
ncbi:MULTISPECIES: LacI family DNA-binding transcriptional regulator [Nonomuraea]|jgi:LacI family transcriptional regulator|uniref:LacI family DNA-binding transcriptional regulator n=1 Tax=Nonomuraea ferruginea TaxID=46174 RepID=A0ABT4SS09_9ACTN|nr:MULTISPECIES: LacI family DNA-binding transcriptional regulator [Nonomuraea]MDA0640056.1 LacI family DNA-binding transcriptional regulator [Nonomuraea ferruginea]TXK38742.1 LacI family transcriptional regulator [Nonomuraea sp. C10]